MKAFTTSNSLITKLTQK